MKDFGGKPLIAWSIEAAQQSRHLKRIVVSTDDPEIAKIACDWGAEVPFLRPTKLAQDNTPGIELVLHALEQLSGYDLVLLLQPTSPLRSVDDIERCIDLQRQTEAPAVVSVVESEKHPNWMITLDKGFRIKPVLDTPFATTRQELPKAYAFNGALYLAKTDWLQSRKTFLTPDTIAYVMPQERSVDLDTPLDWEWCEFLIKRRTG